MNRIINPNAPQRPRSSALDEVLGTMRAIAAYRLHYLDLTAQMQGDGIHQLSASQLTEIEQLRTATLRDMVEFIIYGERKDGKGIDPIARPPFEDTQNHAPKLTEKAT